MLLAIPDKKALWKKVVTQMADSIEPGLFYMLLDRCYLDNLERGQALVIVQTHTLQQMIERKAMKPLEKAFQETMNQPVRVSIAVGRPRIIEKSRPATQPTATPTQAEMDELALLHRQYGDIMGIVDNHPLFHQVCQPLPQGGWGIFPQLLTNACKDYGVLTVLDGLRQIAGRTSVQNPRAAFFDALERGEFGYRLADGACPFPL